MRVPRPTRYISVPVITAKEAARRGTTATIRTFLPRGRRRPLDEAFTGPKVRLKVTLFVLIYLLMLNKYLFYNTFQANFGGLIFFAALVLIIKMCCYASKFQI